MKARSWSWIAMMVIVLTVAGCGSSKDGSKAAGQDASAASKVTISIWSLNNGWDWMKTAIEDFKKENQNVEVELTQYETDPIKEALKVAASARTLPDMWFTWGGTLGSFYADNGMTKDLTQIAADQNWSAKYNKAALDMVTYNGKISGVPIHLNVMGMWYPKSVYDKAGLKAPTTFAEFESQLQKLKDSGVTPLAFGSKGGWHTMRLTEQLLEHFAGPQLHDKLNALDASWNDPAVVKTFEKLKEYTDKGYFPKGYSMVDPTEAEALIYQEQAGMINEGTWFDGTITAEGFDNSKFDVFSFPTEQTPQRASVFAEMFQINGESDPAKQDAAVRLGEFIADYITKNGHGTPATLNAPVSDATPHVSALLDSAKAGGFLITDQALPQEVVQKLFEAQDKVALKEWTPAQAAEEMEKAAQTYKSRKK